MDVEDPWTIGARLRRIRKARGKSLRVVAGLSGVLSAASLSRIENGLRALDSRSEIVALANVLQVAPSELTKISEPLPTSGDTDAATNEIRRVLQAVIVGAPNGQAQTADQLSARVHAMGDLRQRCAYREMGAALPDLIADLHASIDAGHDDARLLHLAVLLHVLGTQTYLHIVRAADDLRLVAAALANDAAQRLDDPVSLGVSVALAETMIPERIRASSRRAGYWMNYGRALARIRRREDAVAALRRAERISPDEVARNPFVREVLGELLARSRRDASGRELRGMAYRAGLPV